jgi:uncharacterized membrane protein HdeD (DUF308 family)
MLLASNWWAVALRGVCGIVFGIIAFARPGIAIAALVLVFGAYALLDGIFAVVAAVRTRHNYPRWGSLLLVGILGIAAGILAFTRPNYTALALVLLVAAWAIVKGIFEIVAAIRLRKIIQHEWLLGLAGVLSIIFGVLVWRMPGTGAVVLALWIGAFMLIEGIIELSLAFRLRHWQRTAEKGAEELAA